MFTGLIEDIGRVQGAESGSSGMRIEIQSPALAPALEIGDSVNIDGACQTVVATTKETFTVEAVGDTLEKTTFRSLAPGKRVNLERAVRADSRMGGHMVMGHVTGTARIISWGPAAQRQSFGKSSGPDDAAAWFLLLGLDQSWADRVAPEGSIAVDGVSLTVAEVLQGGVAGAAAGRDGGLQVRISIIPHTRTATTLVDRRQGDLVNIELDILASYASAALRAALGAAPRLTKEKLALWGYT